MAFRLVSGCFLAWLTVVLLASCIADQQGHINQPVAPPVIDVPPAQKLDTGELRQGIKEDITASSNATASQMTGAVNASISKLAEKLVGLEANLTATLNSNVNLNTQASADLRAKLEASLTAITEMRAEFKMNNEFNARLESRINLDANLVKDLKSQIGSMTAQLDANVNAQAGLYNRIDSKLETVNNTAGRDVNFLPKDVALIMVNQEQQSSKMIITIVGILALVISLAIGWFGKSSYQQADTERKMLNALLLEMSGKLPPEDAAKFEHKFALLGKK